MRAAAPGVLLRFGRCTRRVVKVSGEISDVLPSDAYQMARCLCANGKSPISAKIDQNPDFEQNLVFSFVLRALNYCKRSQRDLRFV